MIRIDLGIPARQAALEKMNEGKITFKKAFKTIGKACVLPAPESVAKELILSFEDDKNQYTDYVEFNLLYKSPKPCECLSELHVFQKRIAELINEAKGVEVRKILGPYRSIIKAMSTHFETIEGRPCFEITVTYRNVDIGDLIQRAEPFVGVAG